ncbi:hypothetical protein ABAC460_15760 [Asticcacaulis sp. AC460]|uniref:methyl-accepting chemotaxis protein n=1 Tax=Asticcacaulis sp. AC460 TaxID=1282360 RepID=UPI0003C40D6C|nr:PAS domain-containing methyl-accepting chemotaxis protein [Asticcacaulis sp. AC460]ESQ88487.1 hypothetical protein ABAC460_15760 [Asticcacaulis sp. AC460]
MGLFGSDDSAFRRAVDKSLAVIRFRPDGTILDANDNFLKTMGYTTSQIVGRHHSLFMPEGAANTEVYRSFWAELRTGEFKEGEFERIAAGGRHIWLQATYNPITDALGRVTAIVKIASDITAEKHQSVDDAGQIAAIQRSQAVISFTMDGTILDANSNFLSTMGYTRGEVVGQNHRLFVPPEEAGHPSYRAFWAALRRGEFQAAEYRRLAKGGREVWIRATYSPIMDAGGKPMKVVKFATDVTAEKIRNADYEGQIEAINRTQAVIAFTLDGIILDANPNFLAATGYGLNEVKGQHHKMFVKRDYAESPEYAHFWDKLRSGQPVSAIYQRFGKNDKPIWLQATYNPIIDAAGRPVKIVKYATDITASMSARTRAVEAADETLNNVEAVASAAEEMHVQVGMIVDSMGRTRDAVQQIHARTHGAGTSTSDMRRAAQAMDGVVQLIAQVAGQINLLALNATIESARAGEAGKGFAVVANEVKQLASQTSAATKRISAEIAAMQTLSDQVVAALSSITDAVDEVQSYVDHAVESIQEQSVATEEISSNMHVATSGVASIGRNLDDWIIGMEERRFDTRIRTARPGMIITSAGVKIPCSLRNISKRGAKVITNDPRKVPDSFDLEIGDNGGTHHCLIVRRGSSEIGIRFAEAVAPEMTSLVARYGT